MKTQKIQVKGNEKLRMKVDYSLFDNPESVKAFCECEDYREFDYNTFFKENPKLHKDFTRQVQVLLNMERSKKSLELGLTPDIDETLTKEEKYLVNDKDLYDIGKTEEFFDNMDKDFLEGLHNNLLKEISEDNSAFNSIVKPYTMRLLQFVAIKSAHIARYVSKFPEYEKNGLVKNINYGLSNIKIIISRLFTKGAKDISFNNIFEHSLYLRQNFYQAFINRYYSEDELKNSKIFMNCLEISDTIDKLTRLIKEAVHKKSKN